MSHYSNHRSSNRRSFLQSSAALSLLGLGACATTASLPSKAQVVVIGGGYGGATAAKSRVFRVAAMTCCF